jgi:hypothetical protein
VVLAVAHAQAKPSMRSSDGAVGDTASRRSASPAFTTGMAPCGSVVIVRAVRHRGCLCCGHRHYPLTGKLELIIMTTSSQLLCDVG